MKISALKLSLSCLSLFVFLAVLTMFAGTALAADTIGVVDSQKILFQHPKFGIVAKQVGEKSRAKQAEIDAAANKTTDGEEKIRILQQGSREMKAEEANLMGPIDRDCQRAVQAVAKARGMTVVLEKNATYFGGTDITQDVIAWLKKNVK